jgi:proteic killer suppression protein
MPPPMRVVFQDARLEGAVRSMSAAGTGFHPDVLRAAYKKLQMLEAALDERDLRNLKSLHYEKLAGDRDGQRSVRVTDRYRFVFALDDGTAPPTLLMLELVDYH